MGADRRMCTCRLDFRSVSDPSHTGARCTLSQGHERKYENGGENNTARQIIRAREPTISSAGRSPLSYNARTMSVGRDASLVVLDGIGVLELQVILRWIVRIQQRRHKLVVVVDKQDIMR
jgi:hypothetical protein